MRLHPPSGPAVRTRANAAAARSGRPQRTAARGVVRRRRSDAPESEPPPVFEDLHLDLPDDPTFEAAAFGEPLATRLSRMLGERRFSEILQEAEKDRQGMAADAQARQIVEQARARLEAAPYVATFVESARQALQAGDTEEAERLMRKARVLDPEHPDLAALGEAQGYYADPERAMGGRRRGISMDAEPGDATAPSGQDLELPDVDFSFAGMAQEEYSLGDVDAGGAEAGSSSSGEHSVRIEELLESGQAACNRGEYQTAIDAWSRIFLIDIDHQEAARRIEKARQLKAEREREVEEILHEGLARFDSDDFESAESAFERVIELSPGHLVAVEHLEKIRARKAAGSAGPVGGGAAAILRGGDLPGPMMEGARASQRGARENMSGEILVPPEPGAGSSRSAEERAVFAVSAKRSAAPARGFMWIGGAVLLLLLAGGWLLLRNRASLFPNSQEPLQTAAPATVDVIARAKALHAEGKTAVAIAQLQRLPPQEPQYAEAQSLISQWEALIKPAAPVPAGLPPERQRKRDDLVAEAERACGQQEYLRCDRALSAAAEIVPLAPDLGKLQDQARAGLEPLTEELKLYTDGEYDFMLNKLWRRRESEPGNKDIRRLIIDAYYNLGVRDLQRGDPPAAVDKFREALALDPGDEPLKRLAELAKVYSQRDQDLLFDIYIRNVPSR